MNLVWVVCLIAAASLVAAVSGVEDKSAEQSMTTGHMLDGDRLVSGEETRALLTIRNEWVQPIVVFGVSGAYLLEDGSRVFRNISIQRKWEEVAVGEERTVEYMIRPEMEACRLRTVLYFDFTDQSETKWYRVEAFNQTLRIVEAPVSYLDLGSLFIYVLLALAGYGITKVVRRSKSSTKSSVSKSSVATKPASVSRFADWVPAQHSRHDQRTKSQ